MSNCVIFHKSLLMLVFLIFLQIVACDVFNPCTEEEVYRITSLDSNVDAIIVDKNCGATTSILREIYIVPKGDSVNNQKPIFRAEKANYLKIEWVGHKQLEISYKKARVLETNHIWSSNEINDSIYNVTINWFRRDSF